MNVAVHRMGVTWFRVTSYRDDIETVEVVKETASQISISTMDSRGFSYTKAIPKSSTFYRHFQTFDEAKEFIVKRNELRVEQAKTNLEKAIAELAFAMKLETP